MYHILKNFGNLIFLFIEKKKRFLFDKSFNQISFWKYWVRTNEAIVKKKNIDSMHTFITQAVNAACLDSLNLDDSHRIVFEDKSGNRFEMCFMSRHAKMGTTFKL